MCEKRVILNKNLASDEKYFEKVARLVAKIYGGHVSPNNHFGRFDVSHDFRSWIYGFFAIFKDVKNIDVDILQKL